MKISVTQTGGVIGTPARFELDSAALSEPEAAELARRTSAVKPVAAPPRLYPGELQYAVRVDDDDLEVEGEYTDGSMPEDIRDLVAWVQAHPSHRRDRG